MNNPNDRMLQIALAVRKMQAEKLKKPDSEPEEEISPVPILDEDEDLSGLDELDFEEKTPSMLETVMNRFKSNKFMPKERENDDSSL